MSRGATLSGLGVYRPRRRVTNEELGATLDTSDEWIRSRVGIRERRVAGLEETVVSMAADAGKNALSAAGLTETSLDLVIVATCTMETSIPQAAAQVAGRIGAGDVGAFDVNSGCAGFTSSLAVARDLVRGGSADHVLVVGSEKFTSWVDRKNRSVAVLMADGAAAAVVSASTEADIGPVVWGSLGQDASVLGIPDRAGFLEMNGREVYRWASSLAPQITEILKVSDLDIADIAAVIPHQANARIIQALTAGVGLPAGVHVAGDLETSGNTGAASVPLALARALRDGHVAPRQLALLFGFGAGLACSGQVVRVPDRVEYTHE